MRYQSHSRYRGCRNLALRQAIQLRVLLVVFECFVLECWTRIWKPQRCCSTAQAEVDFQVDSYYNNQMNFFKGIKPFELITSIMDRNSKDKKSKEKISDSIQFDTPSTPKEQQKPVLAYSKLNSPSYQEAEDFLISLKKTTSEREQTENTIKRKIDLFQKVEIEPHYLSLANEEKLFNFEFQLGSDIFLERVEHLHDQVTQINAVVKRVLSTRKEDAFRYLQNVSQLILEVQQIVKTIRLHRQRLRQLKEHSIYRIIRLIKRKNMIKEKIRLLKQVKIKNEAALMQITNIDQAFATEQSRVKLYRKINKLSELQKSKYVCTIKNRLVSVCTGIKSMVEEGLRNWVEGRLSERQIEKLTVMIYFMEKEEIYRQNSIKIDFSRSSKEELRAAIRKIFEWKSFTYVKDLMTKDKIHEFLNYLLKKLD